MASDGFETGQRWARLVLPSKRAVAVRGIRSIRDLEPEVYRSLLLDCVFAEESSAAEPPAVAAGNESVEEESRGGRVTAKAPPLVDLCEGWAHAGREIAVKWDSWNFQDRRPAAQHVQESPSSQGLVRDGCDFILRLRSDASDIHLIEGLDFLTCLYHRYISDSNPTPESQNPNHISVPSPPVPFAAKCAAIRECFRKRSVASLSKYPWSRAWPFDFSEVPPILLPAVTSLTLSNNSQLFHWREALKTLAMFPALTSLTLHHTPWLFTNNAGKNSAVEALTVYKQTSPRLHTLREFQVSEASTPDECHACYVLPVVLAFSALATLTQLSLGHCGLTDSDFHTQSGSDIHRFDSVKALDLRQNKFSLAALPTIYSLFPNINELDISCNDIISTSTSTSTTASTSATTSATNSNASSTSSHGDARPCPKLLKLKADVCGIETLEQLIEFSSRDEFAGLESLWIYRNPFFRPFFSEVAPRDALARALVLALFPCLQNLGGESVRPKEKRDALIYFFSALKSRSLFSIPAAQPLPAQHLAAQPPVEDKGSLKSHAQNMDMLEDMLEEALSKRNFPHIDEWRAWRKQERETNSESSQLRLKQLADERKRLIESLEWCSLQKAPKQDNLYRWPNFPVKLKILGLELEDSKSQYEFFVLPELVRVEDALELAAAALQDLTIMSGTLTLRQSIPQTPPPGTGTLSPRDSESTRAASDQGTDDPRMAKALDVLFRRELVDQFPKEIELEPKSKFLDFFGLNSSPSEVITYNLHFTASPATPIPPR